MWIVLLLRENLSSYDDETPPPSDSDIDSMPPPEVEDSEDELGFAPPDEVDEFDNRDSDIANETQELDNDDVLQVVGRKVMSNPTVEGATPGLNAALHVMAVRSLNLGLAKVALDFLDHAYNVDHLGDKLVDSSDEDAQEFVSRPDCLLPVVVAAPWCFLVLLHFSCF